MKENIIEENRLKINKINKMKKGYDVATKLFSMINGFNIIMSSYIIRAGIELKEPKTSLMGVIAILASIGLDIGIYKADGIISKESEEAILELEKETIVK